MISHLQCCNRGDDGDKLNKNDDVSVSVSVVIDDATSIASVDFKRKMDSLNR